MYIRSSISDQSWLSMPPAPGLIVRMASFLSSRPESMRWNSMCCSLDDRSSRRFRVSARSSSSSSDSRSSHATLMSASSREKDLIGSVQALMELISEMTESAFLRSPQKSGLAINPLSSVSFFSRETRSKALRKLGKPGCQLLKPVSYNLLHCRFSLSNRVFMVNRQGLGKDRCLRLR